MTSEIKSLLWCRMSWDACRPHFWKTFIYGHCISSHTNNNIFSFNNTFSFSHFALKKIGVARKSTKEKSRKPVFHLTKNKKKHCCGRSMNALILIIITVGAEKVWVWRNCEPCDLDFFEKCKLRNSFM